MIRCLATTLTAAALALAASEAAAINKCVDKSGKVTYQEDKCPDDAKQDVLKAPPGLSSASPAAPDDDREDPRMLDLVSMQLGYEGCATASSDFAQLYAADYSAWRAGNATLWARLERSARYQGVLKTGREQLRVQLLQVAAAPAQYIAFCKGRFIPVMKSNAPK
ncbi:MAG: DUF4124 domain-containing protein [Usitatibacter sp.]